MTNLVLAHAKICASSILELLRWNRRSTLSQVSAAKRQVCLLGDNTNSPVNVSVKSLQNENSINFRFHLIYC